MKPSKKQLDEASKYVKKNFGDVIKRIAEDEDREDKPVECVLNEKPSTGKHLCEHSWKTVEDQTFCVYCGKDKPTKHLDKDKIKDGDGFELYGIPLFAKKGIPKNEIWVMDGLTLKQKIKINSKHLDTLVVPTKLEFNYDGVLGYEATTLHDIWKKQCEIIDYLISLQKEK